jgi:hypothetical protein
MIVYGDPSHEEPAGILVERLKLRAGQESHEGTDGRRTLLIEAGKLEQALADVPAGESLMGQIERVTDLAADAFLGVSNFGPVREALARLEVRPDLPLRVKVPEGFAFYALYPEHYARAAELWIEDHEDAPSRRAVIVGVRSIGTGLSAVAARVLARAGWAVRRLTVRPAGHPYRRRVEIPIKALDGAAFGLVVDEGPGQSGSSMAAAAKALASAGLEPSSIAFLPGHGHSPGTAGSEEIRRWWAKTRRYVAGAGDPIFDGRPLPAVLAGCSGGPVVRMEGLGAGAWRRIVYPDEGEWPAAFPAFERNKYRAVFADGSSVLWKFEGLAGAAGAAASRMARLARRGWGPAPLACTHGFVARPWLEGKPLRREQGDGIVLARIGRYIADAAMPPVPETERRSSVERLREMLYWNTRESLGEAMAERSRAWEGLAPETAWPTYGDGRLGPEEWLRESDGRLLKVDCVGHRTDHTMAGVQPVAWDLAGALVEWGLEGKAARLLLEAYSAAGGRTVPPEALMFYRMAYAAFRLGQCMLCAGMGDPGERRRLERAGEFYRAQLARLLAHQ